MFIHQVGDRGDLDPESERILRARTFLEPQDGKKMLESIPGPIAWIPDVVTDIAASVDRGTSLVANGLKRGKRSNSSEAFFLQKKQFKRK